jgi:hypothetical protein
MSKPSHVAMTARNYEDETGQKKTRWYEIGAAWPTKSGNGLNVTLYATPVDGSFSLFLPKEKPETVPEV